MGRFALFYEQKLKKTNIVPLENVRSNNYACISQTTRGQSYY